VNAAVTTFVELLRDFPATLTLEDLDLRSALIQDLRAVEQPPDWLDLSGTRRRIDLQAACRSLRNQVAHTLLRWHRSRAAADNPRLAHLASEYFDEVRAWLTRIDEGMPTAVGWIRRPTPRPQPLRPLQEVLDVLEIGAAEALAHWHAHDPQAVQDLPGNEVTRALRQWQPQLHAGNRSTLWHHLKPHGISLADAITRVLPTAKARLAQSQHESWACRGDIKLGAGVRGA
jgi:hypothetical protein